MFQLKDSVIRLRSEDDSIKSYINRRYPAVLCADTYHEVDYALRLIFPEGKLLEEEDMHVIRHHEMIKGLFEASELIKVLYVNLHSWCKHFLYDPSIRFDIFSSYEFQVIFLSYLHRESFISFNSDDLNPSEWLVSRCPKDISSEEAKELLPRLFISFLKYFALELSPDSTNFSWLPQDWYRTAKIQDRTLAAKHSNQHSFYQLLIGEDYLDVRRQVRDHQDDAINLVRKVARTLSGIAEGRHYFD